MQTNSSFSCFPSLLSISTHTHAHTQLNLVFYFYLFSLTMLVREKKDSPEFLSNLGMLNLISRVTSLGTVKSIKSSVFLMQVKTEWLTFNDTGVFLIKSLFHALCNIRTVFYNLFLWEKKRSSRLLPHLHLSFARYKYSLICSHMLFHAAPLVQFALHSRASHTMRTQ